MSDKIEVNEDEGNYLWCEQCAKVIDEDEYKPNPDNIEYDMHLDHLMTFSPGA